MDNKYTKCNKNFQTQYAYINNKKININNYIKDSNKKIRCLNGHQLVMDISP